MENTKKQGFWVYTTTSVNSNKITVKIALFLFKIASIIKYIKVQLPNVDHLAMPLPLPAGAKPLPLEIPSGGPSSGGGWFQ